MIILVNFFIFLSCLNYKIVWVLLFNMILSSYKMQTIIIMFINVLLFIICLLSCNISRSLLLMHYLYSSLNYFYSLIIIKPHLTRLFCINVKNFIHSFIQNNHMILQMSMFFNFIQYNRCYYNRYYFIHLFICRLFRFFIQAHQAITLSRNHLKAKVSIFGPFIIINFINPFLKNASSNSFYNNF